MKIQLITLVATVALPSANAGLLSSLFQKSDTHSLGLELAFPGKKIVTSLNGLLFGNSDDDSVDSPTVSPVGGPGKRPADSPAAIGTADDEPEECPQVWYDIAKDLKSEFDGCNRRAATAIRFAFHDAGGYSSKNTEYAPASGGADGSLLLNDEENGRTVNDPMQDFRSFLLDKYNQYSSEDVSAADFVQAAGNIGVISCRGGVKVKTVIGREDSSTAAPEGTLPAAFGPAANYDTLIQLFEDKGISPRELAALMGAHSVSRSFTAQRAGVPRGGRQDTTPTRWDTKYFKQTQAKVAPRNVYRFDSDVNLANPNTTCGEAYTEFGDDKSAWSTAFQDAMYKLSLLGLSDEKKGSLIDCTDILN